MLLTITPLYAGLLGLWYLVLSAHVVRGRRGQQISLGDGGDAAMTRRIRGHANFGEYVPLILLMLAMLELGGGTARWLLHALGVALLIARLAHGVALSFTERWMLGRFIGAALTFTVLGIVSILCIWRGLAVLALG